MNLRSWRTRFFIVIGLMAYGAFDPRYYLWVRKLVTRKESAIADYTFNEETGELDLTWHGE